MGTVNRDPGLSFLMIGSAAFGLGALTCYMLTRRKPTSTTKSFCASSSDTELLVRAASFSAHKHRNQRRKNATRVPYINHPLSAAARLATTGCVVDVVTLAAAMLHDTVEDTETSVEELEREFGMDVAAVVAECSDDKSLDKAARKQAQIDHAPHVSTRAKLVKLADKLDNLSDLLECTPVGWGPDRVAEYFDWAERVIAGLRGTNEPIENALDTVLDNRHVAIDAAAKQNEKQNVNTEKTD